MQTLKAGLIGCGFFADNHLHAWREVNGAVVAAVCDTDAPKARRAAEQFGIPAHYTDLAEMIEQEKLDFVDIVTQPASHRTIVEYVAEQRLPMICQKPMAPSLTDARAMVDACTSAGVPFMIHENFRWQTPMRDVKEAATSIGPLHFGRISFRSAFDVYATQPYLATDERFIVYDLGVHLLDLARFFFGEVRTLTCQTQRVNPAIRAEDTATLLLEMDNGASCVVDMSYAARLAEEHFPQTLVHLEGSEGAVTIDPGYRMTTVIGDHVTRRHAPPQSFSWSRPPGEVIQDSMVSIQQHWVECLRNATAPATSGADNLKTLELVFAAYESADTGEKRAIAP